jgi:hypothetical protein
MDSIYGHELFWYKSLENSIFYYRDGIKNFVHYANRQANDYGNINTMRDEKGKLAEGFLWKPIT